MAATVAPDADTAFQHHLAAVASGAALGNVHSAFRSAATAAAEAAKAAAQAEAAPPADSAAPRRSRRRRDAQPAAAAQGSAGGTWATKRGAELTAADHIRLRDAFDVAVDPGAPGALPVMRCWEEAGLPPPVATYLVETLRVPLPSPVQMQAVPLALRGDDILAVAETGSGKTLAYAVPAVVRAASSRPTSPGVPAALLVMPTRELSLQVGRCLEGLGAAFSPPLAVAVAVQGEAMPATPVGAVVGTLGQLRRLLGDMALSLAGVRSVVVDEADVVVGDGMLNQLCEVLDRVPAAAQQLFFSATFLPALRQLAARFIPKGHTLRVRYRFPHVAQRVVPFAAPATKGGEAKLFGAKLAALVGLVAEYQPPVVVFANTKDRVERLGRALAAQGVPNAAVHGATTDRDAAVGRFRSGAVGVLVATDLLARGLHVDGVRLVVNFELPRPADPDEAVVAYMHRIGRTGRAGQRGTAVTLMAFRSQQDALLAADDGSGDGSGEDDDDGPTQSKGRRLEEEAADAPSDTADDAVSEALLGFLRQCGADGDAPRPSTTRRGTRRGWCSSRNQMSSAAWDRRGRMMRVDMRGVFCAAFLAVAVSAKRFATGSDGAGIDVDAYAGGVMRVRFRTSQAQYEVSDVVVAPAIPLVREECDGAQCSLATESTELALTKTEAGVQLKFSAEGRVLLDAKLGFAEEKPTASVTFPLAERFYGIPERAMDLALDRGASYRLFNLDVFEYKLDDKGPIYGSIPFLMGHGQKATAAVLWLNSADTTVDLKGEEDPTAAWQSDGGVADLFFFPGPTPMHVHKQHSNVVGPTMLPPAFSLGYHQCRWNYRSVADSVDVDAGFDKHNIPYDVLWLDIEHTDGKRYFTWDPHTFAEPEKLVSRLESKGRKLVTISDPHIKRAEGYHVHEEATAKGFYVKTESGADFEGHCWPGQSSWVDFFNKDARTWYASLFQYDRYRGSSPSVFTWIDMNEPSVFNAHEVTMDKKAVHTSHDGRKVSHGQLHNMYGYYHTMAAYEGHIKRNEKPMRPFILTRAFFSGSQRYAAMWTGDNMADWGHLQKSIPMLLTLSLSNYAFVGADVGGFFKNPSEELLVRWYQAAALTPFFRGHAHLETKRREPWLFGAEVTDRIRTAIALRYTLMPYLYTTFFQAHDQGTTVLRPLFYEWPTAAAHFTEQRAFMFGPAILARPVTEEGATTVTVPLPEGETWYAFPTGARHAPGTLELPITMDSIPAFVRGGYVVPTRGRLRRSTTGAVADPLTLYVALDAKGAAAGPVYLDDGASFAFEEGEYLYRRAEYRDGKLTLRPGVSQRCKKAADFASPVFVERVVLFGLPSAPTAASAVYTAAHGAPVELGASRPVDVTTVDGVTTIRRPQLLAQAEWTLSLSF